MQANEFQKQTVETAIYPEVNSGSRNELMYLSLGLAGEAGEIANKVAKYYRDGYVDMPGIRKEIGDCLWYIARLCNAVGENMETAMDVNASKLKDRLQRGVIGGSGDNR